MSTAVRATLLLVAAYAMALVLVAVVSGVVMLAMSPHACREYSETLSVLWATMAGTMCVCWLVVALLAWWYLKRLLACGAVVTVYAVALLATYKVLAFGLMVMFNC
jgi:hypothetical protein